MLLAFISGVASAASFDCAKAGTNIEKIICANKYIDDLDIGLDEIYSSMKYLESFDEIKKSQINWIKSRNECVDRTCLEKTYESRIAALYLEAFQKTRNKQNQCFQNGLLAIVAEGNKPMPLGRYYVRGSFQDLTGDNKEELSYSTSEIEGEYAVLGVKEGCYTVIYTDSVSNHYDLSVVSSVPAEFANAAEGLESNNYKFIITTRIGECAGGKYDKSILVFDGKKYRLLASIHVDRCWIENH